MNSTPHNCALARAPERHPARRWSWPKRLHHLSWLVFSRPFALTLRWLSTSGQTLLAFALSASLACSRAPTHEAASPRPPSPQPARTDAVGPRFTSLGRTIRDASGIRFSWPASGVAFTFEGPDVSLELEDTPTPDTTPETDWVRIDVDGEEQVFALDQGSHFYPLRVKGSGVHTVVLHKRTEAEVGTVTFKSLLFPRGGAMRNPPEQPSHRMLILGDSISAGFGVHGLGPLCPFSPATEDATRTYGAVAAKELGWNYSIVAWSGKGCVRNEDARDPETLPAICERSLATETAPWTDASPFDVVVINLGTNDFQHGYPDLKLFQTGMTNLVHRVRASHPAALIVLMVGPMLYDEGRSKPRTKVRQIMTRIVDASRAHGDPKILLFEGWTDPAEGVGCQFHPNRITQARLGRELAQAIRTAAQE